MTVTYQVGYHGRRMTLTELKAWDRFRLVDPEMQRRLVALMDAARAAGHDVGVGGGFRYRTEQESLFKERHVRALSGCCFFAGSFWKKRDGVAHAAPPGRSFHEATTPSGSCLAVDMVGWQDGWMRRNVTRFGLREFSQVNGEEWHLQPVEVPTSRSQYRPAQHALKPFPLPGIGDPYGIWPTVTKPTIKTGAKGDVVVYAQRVLAEKAGQHVSTDGLFGPGTETAVRNLQAWCKLTVDGVVGPKTWAVIDGLAVG